MCSYGYILELNLLDGHFRQPFNTYRLLHIFGADIAKRYISESGRLAFGSTHPGAVGGVDLDSFTADVLHVDPFKPEVFDDAAATAGRLEANADIRAFVDAGIDIDIKNGKIYWTDAIGSPSPSKIWRSNLDGSNMEDILTEYKNYYDVSLDLASEKLYWAAGDGIYRANYDGSDVEYLINTGQGVLGLDIDMTSNKIYWTNTLTNTIYRSNLDGSNIENLITFGSRPVDIELINTLSIILDIKPRCCPNPLSVNSQGVLTVAILGTEEFDVGQIDPASIRLEGVAPIRSAYKDVSTPVIDPVECECTKDGPDGFDDLVLKFQTQAVLETIGEVSKGEVIELILTGVLADETPIEGSDCVVIHGRL